MHTSLHSLFAAKEFTRSEIDTFICFLECIKSVLNESGVLWFFYLNAFIRCFFSFFIFWRFYRVSNDFLQLCLYSVIVIRNLQEDTAWQVQKRIPQEEVQAINPERIKIPEFLESTEVKVRLYHPLSCGLLNTYVPDF